MKVEEFVQQYGGHYKNYRGGWLLSCPLGIHPDNSPSFSLSVNGLFHCWSCGQAGNYTRLLHDVAGLSWKKSTEIVTLLDLRKQWTKQTKRIYEQDEKPTISSAVLGLYDVDWFAAYQIYRTHNQLSPQYSNKRPPWALVFDKGFLPQTLTHFDAGYDTEDQRITIPVWNHEKKLLGILGRACRHLEAAKYIPYASFKHTQHIYNLQATNIGEPVVLVEGAFDVWMLWQWEIPFTAIATLGSHLSHQQMSELLEKHSQISLFYDNDFAGQEGAQHAARLLTRHGGKVDIISTSKGVTNIKDMTFGYFMDQYRNRQSFPSLGNATTLDHKATTPSRRVSS